MKELLIKLMKRGSLKTVSPNENLSVSYVEKSKSNFESSQILFSRDKLEEAVTFVYYSMYNLVLALLYRVGIKSENHLASIFLLKKLFDFDNSSIKEAKAERIDKQYYVGFNISKKEVGESLKSAEGFNRELKSFIFGLGNKEVLFYRNKFEVMLNE